jgi:hypothetical protein
MDALNITRLRLQNQYLASPALTSAADLVYYMGAIQAQDYAGAKWAIAQRLKGANDALIEKAFTDGKIIRTHVMRPTWHFVSPKDIRWMLELTAHRVQALANFRHRQLKLDKGIFSTCEKTLTKILNGGKQLSRDEVALGLQHAGVNTDELRFVHIMMEMELIGLVCSGGRQGKQFTYTLLDDRVPETKTLARDEALATLAERYFTAHGPATIADYAWWSGLMVEDCKAGLGMINDKLLSRQLNGHTYWFAETDTGTNSKAPYAFLLPNYDEYIVSYKDRSDTIKEKHIDQVDPRGTIFNHTIILNGLISGTWKRGIHKDKVILDITPFKQLSKVNHAAVVTAAKRYSKFLGVKNFELKIS